MALDEVDFQVLVGGCAAYLLGQSPVALMYSA